MKKLIIMHICTSLMFVIFLGIGFFLYNKDQQLTNYSKTFFILGAIMAIAEMPLTLKLTKMKQENQQKSETTTDFTSLGKK